MHQLAHAPGVAKKIAIKDCNATWLVSLFEKALAEEKIKYTTIVDNFLNLANEIANRPQGQLKTFLELQFLYFYLCDAEKECGEKISKFLKQSIQFSDDAGCFNERNIILSCYPYPIHKRAEFLSEFRYSYGTFSSNYGFPELFTFYVNLKAKTKGLDIFQNINDFLTREEDNKYSECDHIDDATVDSIKRIYKINYNIGEAPEFTCLEYYSVSSDFSCFNVTSFFLLKNAFSSELSNIILSFIIEQLIVLIPSETRAKIHRSQKTLNSVKERFSHLISNTKGLCKDFKIRHEIKVYGNEVCSDDDVVIHFYHKNRPHEEIQEIKDFVFSVCNAVACSTTVTVLRDASWRIDEFNEGIVLIIPHERISDFQEYWPTPSKWISDVPIIPYKIFECFLTQAGRFDPRFWLCLEKSNCSSLVKFAVDSEKHTAKKDFKEGFKDITGWLREVKVPDNVIVKLWCYNSKMISIDTLSVIDSIFEPNEGFKMRKGLFLGNPLFRRFIIEYLQIQGNPNGSIFEMVCSENIEKIIQEMLKQYNANFVGLKEEDSYMIRFFMNGRLDVAFRILFCLLKAIDKPLPIQIAPRVENNFSDFFASFFTSSNRTATTKNNNAQASIVNLMCETLRLCFESDIDHEALYQYIKANKFLEKYSEIQNLLKDYKLCQLLLQNGDFKPARRK